MKWTAVEVDRFYCQHSFPKWWWMELRSGKLKKYIDSLPIILMCMLRCFIEALKTFSLHPLRETKKVKIKVRSDFRGRLRDVPLQDRELFSFQNDSLNISLLLHHPTIWTWKKVFPHMKRRHAPLPHIKSSYYLLLLKKKTPITEQFLKKISSVWIRSHIFNIWFNPRIFDYSISWVSSKNSRKKCAGER